MSFYYCQKLFKFFEESFSILFLLLFKINIKLTKADGRTLKKKFKLLLGKKAVKYYYKRKGTELLIFTKRRKRKLRQAKFLS